MLAAQAPTGLSSQASAAPLNRPVVVVVAASPRRRRRLSLCGRVVRV